MAAEKSIPQGLKPPSSGGVVLPGMNPRPTAPGPHASRRPAGWGSRIPRSENPDLGHPPFSGWCIISSMKREWQPTIRRVKALLWGLFFIFVYISAYGQSAFQVNYEVIRKSVVFIYARGADGQTQPAGTGFLISIPTKSNQNKVYVILVTARHMVDPSWLGCQTINFELVARFNKKSFDPKSNDQGTVDYDFRDDSLKGLNWIVPLDNSVDIAYRILDAPKLESLGVEYIALSPINFPKPNELQSLETGSQIMSAGLFPGASGKKRNYPIFKFGYISSRPDEKISSQVCPNGRQMDLTQWMIAASLVPGNSGSPIFFVPVGFNGVSFGGAGRATLIGVQSTSFVGWDIAGMSPIQFLIDSLKSANIPDADFSVFESPVTPPVMPSVNVH